MRLPLNRTVLWSCVLLSPFTGPLGETSLGLHVLVIVLAAGIGFFKYGMSPIRNAMALWLLALLLSLHLVVANAISPCTDTLAKSIASHVAFLVVLLALLQLAGQGRPIDLTKDIRLLVILISGSVIAQQSWLYMQGEFDFEGMSGIFFETSHLALSVTPLLVALIFATSARDRWLGWLATAVFFVLSASATLFILMTACLFASSLATSRSGLSGRSILQMSLALFVICATIYLSPYRDEFLSRIEGVNNISIISNASSVVYVNGWETAIENLWATNGIGLGFNRMGCNPRPDTATGAILDALNLWEANFNDGSFTMAKVLSELGLFGGVAWVFASLFLIRLLRLPQNQADAVRSVTALATSAIVVLVIGGLVRGTGYFAGPVLLGLFFLAGSLFSAGRRSSK